LTQLRKKVKKLGSDTYWEGVRLRLENKPKVLGKVYVKEDKMDHPQKKQKVVNTQLC